MASKRDVQSVSMAEIECQISSIKYSIFCFNIIAWVCVLFKYFNSQSEKIAKITFKHLHDSCQVDIKESIITLLKSHIFRHTCIEVYHDSFSMANNSVIYFIYNMNICIL